MSSRLHVIDAPCHPHFEPWHTHLLTDVTAELLVGHSLEEQCLPCACKGVCRVIVCTKAGQANRTHAHTHKHTHTCAHAQAHTYASTHACACVRTCVRAPTFHFFTDRAGTLRIKTKTVNACEGSVGSSVVIGRESSSITHTIQCTAQHALRNTVQHAVWHAVPKRGRHLDAHKWRKDTWVGTCGPPTYQCSTDLLAPSNCALIPFAH